MRIMTDDELRKHIANRLRTAREWAGLTQNEVADRLGIARSTWTQIETGRNDLSVKYLVQLQEIFNQPINYILGIEVFGELTEDEADLVTAYRNIGNPTIRTHAKITVKALARYGEPVTQDQEYLKLVEAMKNLSEWERKNLILYLEQQKRQRQSDTETRQPRLV